ncbi:hypothetical protein GOP47_0020472 [Adiantum capillus-veneris]|uniref:N-acetyltransferase ESCO zinc-finger domain-containing protein n=1 Tax=Adiantum capillus-veneris TaxID=13818 RepID=A0A9D4Z7S2_ADICA|nr:hypothetical protein GOP47_0020472 [Adiantum capillus-veneris]
MASEGAVVTYGRRKRRAPESDWDDNENEQASPPLPPPSAPTQTGVPKCRQVFLDFGQTDFTCSTCKICGLLYARGHSEDERLHACFHKCYLRGRSFKGWQKERIVAKDGGDDGRVILVLDSDPLQHQLKVKEIVKIMEKELGIEPGWLLYDRCKVCVNFLKA